MQNAMTTRHTPVLLNEVIANLNLPKGGKIIDCTLGDGGHSEEFLKIIGPKGKLLGIDADPESLLRAKQYLYNYTDQTTFVRDNFRDLKKVAKENGFEAVDGILMDLGWSSPQFAERNRGFSFLSNEPLDMRYSGGMGETMATAGEIVNTYSEVDLEHLFKFFGEEDLAAEITEEIIEQRKIKRIETSGELTEVILKAYRKKLKTDKEVPWVGGIHPATKVFQALRIEVNHELEVLKQALPQAVGLLTTGGRLAVITFHSLEDRIVKQFFQKEEHKTLNIITKKPVVATEEEIKSNPRSRSAKLRVIEKI